MNSVCLLRFLCGIAVVTGEAASVDKLTETIRILSAGLINQQLLMEEKVRSDGDSGVKQIRHSTEGNRPYYGETHAGRSGMLSIHNHANTIRTLGMGELSAVLNGVEFRTRHNDPALKMPHPTSSVYEKTTEIKFPKVPPEVLNAGGINEQIVEMRKWFKAWQRQDKTSRNYKRYFKAVLCYLEGAWTDMDLFSEPFWSSEHTLDASSWEGLRDRVLMETYRGGKSYSQNYAALPISVVDNQNGTLTLVQWNYRVMCHPLKQDVPLTSLIYFRDMSTAMTNHKHSTRDRSARFIVKPVLRGYRYSSAHTYGFLDKLMAEIPGKDNYVGQQSDNSLGKTAYEYKKNANGSLNELNAAFYHRWYRTTFADASGSDVHHRGFSDENCFMAKTKQARIPGRLVQTDCKMHAGCTTEGQRWTYAIPLEIVYLTPLLRWNPYNIVYKGDKTCDEAQTVAADGRWGSTTNASRAYNGSNSDLYYRTPYEFFTAGEVWPHPADTVQEEVGVLDVNGILRKTRASGTRVVLPRIPDVGILRTRYPIAPVHGEGSSVWKELNALKEIIVNPLAHEMWLHREWRDVLRKLQV